MGKQRFAEAASLVLGVGAASVLESFRPTVIGRDGFVRELGAPVIGELPAPPSALDGMALGAVAGRLRLAAVAAEVDRIELIFTDHAQYLSEFILRKWEALGRPCDRRAIERAEQFAGARQDAYDSSTAVLIHGDGRAVVVAVASEVTRVE